MLRPARSTILAGLLCLAASAAVSAADTFYVVSHRDLRLSGGELPEAEELSWRERRNLELRRPYAVLDKPGEVFVVPGTPEDVLERRRNDTPLPGTSAPRPFTIAVRAPAGGDVAGTLYVANSDATAMIKLRFVIPARYGETTVDEHKDFLRVKQRHFENLVDEGVPGGAWFRRQAREAAFERTGTQDREPVTGRVAQPTRTRADDLEDSFAVFSGGRAIRENLQLDRLVAPDTKGGLEEQVPIDSLEGITIAEVDWKPLLEGLKPQLDPLSAYVPHDQHALFFPNFQALVKMVDEARLQGTPVLHLARQRTEDARSLERYQKQLCLELDEFVRKFGDTVIRSVVMTGSDPYLPTGTDVAVLFETESPAALQALIKARQLAVSADVKDAKQSSGEIGGLQYAALVSPSREVSSYVVAKDNVVLVTNSTVQIERFAQVTSGAQQSLADLPEFQFFRHRYPLANPEETAFLMLTDATIRRWCGPKWRIATSRRTHAAAVMADLQAKHLKELVHHKAEPTRLETSLFVPEMRDLRLGREGVFEATYGSLEFQTPIAELELSHVTKTEAEAYRQWRGRYQQYWRRFFDPIGISFTVKDRKLAADVTVMPLIAGTDYRELLRLTLGSKLAENSGDRHPEALVHWIISIKRDSPQVQQAEGMFGAFGGNFGADPLGWLGSSLEVYADADPFWMDLAQAEDPEAFMKGNFHRLPIAFRADVSDNLKLALFLAGVRTMVNQAAPGLVNWENREHGETSYVVLSPARGGLGEGLGRLRVYYATAPGSLVISLNEDVIRRFLDRTAQRSAAGEKTETVNKTDDVPAPQPWKGENVAFQVHKNLIQIVAGGLREEYNRHMQALCWSNLPILNSYRRHFPNQQPMQIQEEFWHARLLCPGGGEYVWNKEFQTYESTVYGHPGQPKDGPPLPANLAAIEFLNAGLTFEDDGLRARLEVERTAAPPR